MLEIHNHGSVAIINKMFETLEKINACRFALPGEFSKRAFINGKNDLIHFEGLANLISSETEQQRIVASQQTFGQVQNICKEWREKIVENLAILDSAIDFPEEGEDYNFKIVLKDLKKSYKLLKKLLNSQIHANKLIKGRILLYLVHQTAESHRFIIFYVRITKQLHLQLKGLQEIKTPRNLKFLGLRLRLQIQQD